MRSLPKLNPLAVTALWTAATLLTAFHPLQAQEASPPTSGTAATDPAPLFAVSEPLVLTIRADFDQLTSDRDDENPEREGMVLGVGPDGEAFELDVLVRTRGNFRLRRSTCRFPPLRLNFKKKQVQALDMGEYDKVKLVTHCNEGDFWDQQVLKEFMAYKVYNEITPESFRVRLARITYVDTSGDRTWDDRMAFLIEPDEALAARVGGTVMEIGQLHPGIFPAGMGARVSLFQFLIGNTDWSMVKFHNTVPLYIDGRGYVIVPYDFDFSGLVDAPYAVPADLLGTRDVRERIYRGWCWEVDWPSAAAEILDRREPIMEAVRSHPWMDEGTANRLAAYLEDGFEVIGSDGLRSREIERACRTW